MGPPKVHRGFDIAREPVDLPGEMMRGAGNLDDPVRL
jgi:hypothetical protein